MGGHTYKRKSVEKNVVVVGVMAIIAIIIINLILNWIGIDHEYNGIIWNIHIEIPLLVFIMIILLGCDSNLYIRKHQHQGTHTEFAVGSLIAIIAVVLSIIFHEMGHGVVLSMFGNGVKKAGISWWGAYVSPSMSLLERSPFEEIMVALAGPCVNLLIGLGLMAVVRVLPESMFENSVRYVSHINIRLARWNMFPFIMFDGGKALDGFIRLFVTDNAARIITLIVSAALIMYVYKIYRKTHKPLEDILIEL